MYHLILNTMDGQTVHETDVPAATIATPGVIDWRGRFFVFSHFVHGEMAIVLNEVTLLKIDD